MSPPACLHPSVSEEVYFESLQQVFPLRSLTSKVLGYIYNDIILLTRLYTHTFGWVALPWLLVYDDAKKTDKFSSLSAPGPHKSTRRLLLYATYVCTRISFYCYFTRSPPDPTRVFSRLYHLFACSPFVSVFRERGDACSASIVSIGKRFEG